MRFTQLVLLVALCCMGWVPPTYGQVPSAANEEALLTLDDAVSLALSNNRLIKNSSLEAEKFDYRLNTVRSRRLPQFQLAALGGELMHSYDFTFAQGVFGTYPNIGPVPATTTEIRAPARFATFVIGSINQPLTQQYKIALGIRATELGREIAREELRAQRQKIAAEVRSTYFELVATDAGVNAAREAVKTLEEAQRLTARHLAEQTVLRADALEVDARLAKSRYELAVAENGLTTQREHLNQLMGRKLATPFRTAATPEDDATVLTLEAARQQASENRPEVREAQLKVRQADYDRRIAQADRIPDLSLSMYYLGLNNVRVLPANVGIAGFLFRWEPFDWGRRHDAVAEKAKVVAQARNGAEETKAQIAVEVGLKYRKWQETTLLLKASRAAQQAVAEQVRVVNNKYKEQAALIKDLLQNQARSSEAAYQYQQALSSYWSALADLRRAMGEE